LPGLTTGLAGLARLRSEHPAGDGSARLLVELADGQTVESVLLAPGRIAGLCVSTQVGCAVGCVFCMTGQGGLLRQLGSAEIVAQVALARTLRPVHKVVFMGMGEPAHNLDAVMEAIELLGTAGAIGHKNLVFSTVGDVRVFERLAHGPVRPAAKHRPVAAAAHSPAVPPSARPWPAIHRPRFRPAARNARAGPAVFGRSGVDALAPGHGRLQFALHIGVNGLLLRLGLHQKNRAAVRTRKSGE
jgi:hypothetical protein